MHDMKEFNYKPFDKGFSYESPITYHIREIYDKQMVERENAITIRVSECIGVDVNREELIKALNYDRQQYEKGYADAKAEYKTKECDDCVSRQSILNEIHKAQDSLKSDDDIIWERNKGNFKGLAWANRIILDAPSVLSKREQAEWLDNKCSACGKGIEDLIDSREWYENERPNYCPFCGKKFKESED